MKKVVIVQRIVPHYRIPFFKLLHDNLKKKGIEFELIYGQEHPGTVPKTVMLDFEWATFVKNKNIFITKREFVWQPIWQHCKGSNLIIVEQANRLVINYFLILNRYFSGAKIAFWGHGKNFQTKNHNGLAEKLKKFVSVKVDWWFGYTEESCRIVSDLGFDRNKITNVKNSIDTTELIQGLNNATENDIESLKKEMEICSNNIAVYCGGLYKEKRLQFLLDACLIIKQKVDDFNIVIIGSGPDFQLVESFATNNKWVHLIGAITGVDRVPYFTISKLSLMPGLVGLAVLDSFALEVPMVTTDIPFHSPEFNYLESGTNGMVTEDSVKSYANEVIDLLMNDTKHLTLVNGCKQSSAEYSIEGMARNFAEGIVEFLSTSKS